MWPVLTFFPEQFFSVKCWVTEGSRRHSVGHRSQLRKQNHFPGLKRVLSRVSKFEKWARIPSRVKGTDSFSQSLWKILFHKWKKVRVENSFILQLRGSASALGWDCRKFSWVLILSFWPPPFSFSPVQWEDDLCSYRERSISTEWVYGSSELLDTWIWRLIFKYPLLQNQSRYIWTFYFVSRKGYWIKLFR